MTSIFLYSKNNCPQCVIAKALLHSRNIEYVELNIETNAAARDVLLKHGLRSLPQVFEGESLIGSVDQLRTWIELKEQTL